MVKARRCGMLVLAGTLGLGCSGGDPDTGPAPRAEPSGPAAIPQGVEMTIVGTVAVVGSTPLEQVIVRRPDDRSLELRGELVSELRSLSGAEVRVWGRVAPGRVLQVRYYDVLEIAGRTPAVGRLEVYDWGVAIESGYGRLHIYDPPPDLRREAGQKVWVNVGSSNNVQSYGVIGKK